MEDQERIPTKAVPLPYNELPDRNYSRDQLRHALKRTNKEVFLIAFNKIVVREGFNWRRKPHWMTDEEWEIELEIPELAASIEQNGQIEEFKGDYDLEKDIFWLEDGYCRFLAQKYLIRTGLRPADMMVEIIVNPKGYTELDRAKGIYTSQHRKNLTPLQLATGFQRMKDNFGLTNEQISKELGRSRQWVDNIMLLNLLSDEQKELIERKKLSVTDAQARIRSERAQEKTKKKAPEQLPPAPNTELPPVAPVPPATPETSTVPETQSLTVGIYDAHPEMQVHASEVVEASQPGESVTFLLGAGHHDEKGKLNIKLFDGDLVGSIIFLFDYKQPLIVSQIHTEEDFFNSLTVAPFNEDFTIRITRESRMAFFNFKVPAEQPILHEELRALIAEAYQIEPVADDTGNKALEPFKPLNYDKGSVHDQEAELNKGTSSKFKEDRPANDRDDALPQIDFKAQKTEAELELNECVSMLAKWEIRMGTLPQFQHQFRDDCVRDIEIITHKVIKARDIIKKAADKA